MSGVEYILLHVQEPILYVIRKQYRNSPTDATPMADYYIIAGTVYQAPDLANVFNSRIVSRLADAWNLLRLNASILFWFIAFNGASFARRIRGGLVLLTLQPKQRLYMGFY